MGSPQKNNLLIDQNHEGVILFYSYVYYNLFILFILMKLSLQNLCKLLFRFSAFVNLNF